jgi:hypothetical protein
VTLPALLVTLHSPLRVRVWSIHLDARCACLVRLHLVR